MGTPLLTGPLEEPPVVRSGCLPPWPGFQAHRCAQLAEGSLWNPALPDTGSQFAEPSEDREQFHFADSHP